MVQFASMKWQFMETIILQLRMQAKHLLHSTFLRMEVSHCWHVTCTLRTGSENSSGVLSKDLHVCWHSSPALCICCTADVCVAFQVTFFFLPGYCDVFPTPPNETGICKQALFHLSPPGSCPIDITALGFQFSKWLEKHSIVNEFRFKPRSVQP